MPNTAAPRDPRLRAAGRVPRVHDVAIEDARLEEIRVVRGEIEGAEEREHQRVLVVVAIERPADVALQIVERGDGADEAGASMTLHRVEHDLPRLREGERARQ